MTGAKTTRPGRQQGSALDLGRAIGNFTWAGMLLGAGALRSPRKVAGSLDALALESRRRLPPLPQAFFSAAEDLQDEWLRHLPHNLEPGSWRRFAGRLRYRAGASLRFLGSGEQGSVTRREISNKLLVYAAVRRASAVLDKTVLDKTAAGRRAFEGAAQRALGQLDASLRLWALEGLGHGHARAVLAREPHPEGLMMGLGLPENARLIVHLGLGMALTEHVLREPPTGTDALQGSLWRLGELCVRNSEPRHLDATLEAVGLVVRCFFPERTAAVGRSLEQSADPALRRTGELFWHGVGRALYFLPLHLLPGYSGPGTALDRLAAEAPHPRALREGRSGIAYALTMVNLGDPAVLEGFLRRRPEAWDDAFRDGVLSALRMRRRLAPEDPETASLLAFTPARPEDEERWRRRVREPLQQALDAHSSHGGEVASRLAEAPTGARKDQP